MKRLTTILSILMALSILLGACAKPTATEEVAVVIEEAPPTEVPEVAPTEEEPVDPADVAAALPRNETMYFNGQQWGPVVGWNPY